MLTLILPLILLCSERFDSVLLQYTVVPVRLYCDELLLCCGLASAAAVTVFVFCYLFLFMMVFCEIMFPTVYHVPCY